MADYIDKQAFLDYMKRTDRYFNVKFDIENFPNADVSPVRHGRWEMNSDRPDNIICTNCGVGFDVWKHESKDFNYCPNCGAKMDGGA